MVEGVSKMEKIILPKGAGKTTKLIQMSHDTWTYILVANEKRQKYLATFAKELGINIPYPVTLENYMGAGFRNSSIKKILIDDADDVLRTLFGNLEIVAITMRQ